jgi:hypothetical protein
MSKPNITRQGTGRWTGTINGEPVELSRLEQHLAIQDALILSAEYDGAEVVISHDITFRVNAGTVAAPVEPVEPVEPVDPEPEEPEPAEPFAIKSIHVLYPTELSAESLGEEMDVGDFVVVGRDADGHDYAAVQMDGGVRGWVGVEVNEYEHADRPVLRAFPGATFHPKPGAGYKLTTTDASVAEAPPESYVYSLPALPTDGPVTLGPLVPAWDHVTTPDIGQPGRPEFEALPDGGARVTWTPAESADAYRVECATGCGTTTTDTALVIDFL